MLNARSSLTHNGRFQFKKACKNSTLFFFFTSGWVALSGLVLNYVFSKEDLVFSNSRLVQDVVSHPKRALEAGQARLPPSKVFPEAGRSRR